MPAAQDASSLVAPPRDGLRERKKVRTRSAIERAALDLFEAQGYEATTVEQIAAQAEVATATFFRYFPSKAEVVVDDNNSHIPAMTQAILDRPRDENDLVAIRHAIIDRWVAVVDPQMTARKSRIVASSDLLRGLSYHRGQQWLVSFVDALAQRRGVEPDDPRCMLIARFALAALASAVEGWIERDCVDDLATEVQSSFELVVDVCGELSRRV
jgi:AcrR family transcriptional regulator